MTRVYDLSREYDEGLNIAAELIKNGEIVAFPTETVYGLGASAFDKAAVEKIYAAKGRPSDNPLIVHVCDMEMAKRCAYIDARQEQYLRRFWPGPFSAVLKKRDCIPTYVTAGLGTVALRFPANEYAAELIRRSGLPIAAPSANTSGKPSPTTARHVAQDMDGRIPVILDGGECDVGLESTVCDLTGEHPVLLRPGAVTLEMLHEIDSLARLHSGLKTGDTPPSPGMKYKHYAPAAQFYIVAQADMTAAARVITELVKKDAAAGKRAVVLISDDKRGLFPGCETVSLGETDDDKCEAHALFAALRECDERGADTAYAVAASATGLGLAIAERMQKAAGGKIITE